MDKYEEQLQRVERFYQRLISINDRTEPIDVDCEIDDIYSFFMHCYHLKDYLKNDSNYSKHTNRQIEDFVNSTPWLQICRDICNGIKHLILNYNRATPTISDNSTAVVENAGNIVVAGNGMEIITRFEAVIEQSGYRYDAFTIAEEALNAWKRFIN